MIKQKLTVKNGSYKNAQGQEKFIYQDIGHLHEGQYGKYITLFAHINLSAFPRKEGDNRVMVNLYDVDGKKDAPNKTEDVPF
tara:strand:+ start:646 stop:891 length:246 start_codon:yes stop_codon:yes gene_type:complete